MKKDIFCDSCLKTIDIKRDDYVILGNFDYVYMDMECYGHLNLRSRYYRTRVDDKFATFISVILTIYIIYFTIFMHLPSMANFTIFFTAVMLLFLYTRFRYGMILSLNVIINYYLIETFDTSIWYYLTATIVGIIMILFVWHPKWKLKKGEL